MKTWVVSYLKYVPEDRFSISISLAITHSMNLKSVNKVFSTFAINFNFKNKYFIYRYFHKSRI